MRVPSVQRLGLISAIVFLTAWLVAPIPFMMETNAEIDVEEAGRVVRHLRGCLETGEAGELPGAISKRQDAVLPVLATVWRGGRRVYVGQVTGKPLPEAVENLAEGIAAQRSRILDATTRIQVDFALAEGWIPEDGLLFSLSFVEGHDGVVGVVDGEKVYLPPSELIRWSKYGTFRPMPGYDSRFKIGLDRKRAEYSVGSQAEALKVERGPASDLRRFESLTVVEGADLAPRRLLKATVDRPVDGMARIQAAVEAGADYLVRALEDDGIFVYDYRPLRDRKSLGAYNWPRHAGTAYSLALVGRILEREDLVEASGRALEGFEKQLAKGPGGNRCLLAKGNCYLGSSALGLLALAEYRIASGDGRFDDSAAALAGFLRHMQRDDGTFRHKWYPDRGVDEELMKLYATQQAVLALGRYGRAAGSRGDLEAARKGMDYLAGPYWDFFMGSYFFGQEHWSCLAAEEMYDHFGKPEYAALCHGIGVHYDNITHNVGDTPYREDVGGMSITHMFTPSIGGTATAAEAMVSAIILGRAEGLDVAGIETQLHDTFGFLLRGQVQAHDTFWMPDGEFAIGGVLSGQSRTNIRIDTVQHTISALVRGLELSGEEISKADLDRARKAYISVR